MDEIAIKVENLSKLYQIGSKKSGSFIESFSDLFGNKPKVKDDLNFWALKDVSFEIVKGDAVGIIGKNGAGKSTLLKVLSRITDPTHGKIEINGRVSSLLEVGTGFHPELSGRDNIFLNGTILGMKRREVKAKFDEIVEFSGISKFIDTPVKHYSSGMYVRLAFAVAAHLEPEILIIDEVLAVGDAEFQRKCLGKMEDVSKNHGRTVLFVSHNMQAVQNLCKKAIFMKGGTSVDFGTTNVVINNYLKREVKNNLEQEWLDPEVAPGNDEVRLRSIGVMPQGDVLRGITIRTPLTIKFEFLYLKEEAKLNLSLHFFSVNGDLVFAVASPRVDCKNGVHSFFCDLPGDFLNDGIYTIKIMIVKNATSLFTLDEGVTFEVHDFEERVGWYGKWPGAVRPKFNWNIKNQIFV